MAGWTSIPGLIGSRPRRISVSQPFRGLPPERAGKIASSHSRGLQIRSAKKAAQAAVPLTPNFVSVAEEAKLLLAEVEARSKEPKRWGGLRGAKAPRLDKIPKDYRQAVIELIHLYLKALKIDLQKIENLCSWLSQPDPSAGQLYVVHQLRLLKPKSSKIDELVAKMRETLSHYAQCMEKKGEERGEGAITSLVTRAAQSEATTGEDAKLDGSVRQLLRSILSYIHPKAAKGQAKPVYVAIPGQVALLKTLLIIPNTATDEPVPLPHDKYVTKLKRHGTNTDPKLNRVAIFPDNAPEFLTNGENVVRIDSLEAMRQIHVIILSANRFADLSKIFGEAEKVVEAQASGAIAVEREVVEGDKEGSNAGMALDDDGDLGGDLETDAQRLLVWAREKEKVQLGEKPTDSNQAKEWENANAEVEFAKKFLEKREGIIKAIAEAQIKAHELIDDLVNKRKVTAPPPNQKAPPFLDTTQVGALKGLADDLRRQLGEMDAPFLVMAKIIIQSLKPEIG